MFCNKCGHSNPPDAGFCSACAAPLDVSGDQTIPLAKTDRLPDPIRPAHDGHIDGGGGALIVRSGAQAGQRFLLADPLTRLGRHPDNEIMLDDITVSRRHAVIERTATGYVARDAGSLNGTYVNQVRIEESPLRQGDELQVGKFRLVYYEHGQ